MSKVQKKDFEDLLKKSINEKYKERGIRAKTAGDHSERLTPTKFVSTGDDILDLIISNTKHGGVPFGRYLNIYSDSGLGKSLLMQKIMANTQKMGGTAIYFDTEGGLYTKFMKVLGIDINRLIYYDEMNAIEDIFENVIDTVLLNIETDNQEPIVIGVDSMTAVTTRDGAKLDETDQKGYGEGARKQLLLGELFKKSLLKIKQPNVIFITTDQIRDKIGATQWERQWRDTAGWAQTFYSDIRLELTPRGAIKNKQKEVIGNKVNIKLVKSRISPHPRSYEAFIYGTRGLDKYKSLIEKAKDLNVLKKGRDKIKFKIDGEEYRREDGNLPTEMDFKRLLKEDPSVYDMVYDQIAEKMIIEYEMDDTLIDDDENIIEDINDE